MEIHIYLSLYQSICMNEVAIPQYEKILAALMIVRSPIFQRDLRPQSMQFVSSEFHGAMLSHCVMSNDGSGGKITGSLSFTSLFYVN